MGRSEAPLSRDPREETPGGANREELSGEVPKRPVALGWLEEALPCQGVEKLRGVESKFNERDPLFKQWATQFRLLFFQPQ